MFYKKIIYNNWTNVSEQVNMLKYLDNKHSLNTFAFKSIDELLLVAKLKIISDKTYVDVYKCANSVLLAHCIDYELIDNTSLE